MAEQAPKSGNWAEQGLRFLRNVHAAIGAVALGAAAVLSNPAVAAFGVYEFLNAGVHEVARRIIDRPKVKKAGGLALAGAS